MIDTHSRGGVACVLRSLASQQQGSVGVSIVCGVGMVGT